MERLPTGWRSIDPAPGDDDVDPDDQAGGELEVAIDPALTRPTGVAASADGAGTGRRGVVGLAGLVVLAIAAALVLLSTAPPQPVVMVGEQTAVAFVEDGRSRDASPSRGAGRSPVVGVGVTSLVVDVGGAVARPGVYRLPPGSRVGDALREAGGFSPAVDVAAVERSMNLAAALADGSKLHVPSLGDAAIPTGAAAASTGSSVPPAGAAGPGPIDLNHATAEQLDSLPGVGPATAAKIIAAREERPFASVDELDERGVVGPSTLAKLRALVTVGP